MPSKKMKLQRKRQHEHEHEHEHEHPSEFEHQEASKPATTRLTNGVGAMHGVVNNGPIDTAANATFEPSPAPTPAPVPDPITQASALKEQGNAAFKAKRYGDAIDLYTKAIALHPTEPTYLTNRAASHMAIKHFRDALADCQAAVSLQSHPASQSSSSHPPPPPAIAPKTLIRLAKCHLALGNPVPALSTLRTALSSVGAGADTATTAAVHEVERAARRMETHLTRFTAARTAGDWGLARLALDQAVQECEGGEPVEWRCWRVEVELAGGRVAGAMAAVNEAFQLDKKSPDVLCVRALVLFISSKLPAATQHAQLALTYDPDHVRARTLLRRIREVERLKEEGNVAFRGEKWGEAVGRYGDALEVVGKREEEAKGGAVRGVLLANRGAAYVKMERHGEAMADTNASLVLVPTSYKALRTRGRIHLALEDYEAAVVDFKAALEQVRVEGSEVEERRMKEELRGAEVALKRSKSKDYYKILGVSKESGEQEIKRAYRKQSLLHHPDKGGDEEKFKLASEAYNVLSDPQKRRRYDAGDDDLEGMTGSASDFSDLFAGGGFSFGGFASEGGGGARFHQHTRGGFPF